mmetsp:Transcript_66680/g.171697  ORF Transcript_66680/g.171697 Transcript_66680/m.171697 type:complete len:85 (-) Transcript_66680:153-407(-)
MAMSLRRAALALLLCLLFRPLQALQGADSMRGSEKRRAEAADSELQAMFFSALECDEETQALTHELHNKFNSGGARYIKRAKGE